MPETTETGFQIPTVAELIARIEQDFAARMGNDDVRIPLSFTWAAVRILAGLAYVLYRYGAHTAAQAIYDRAFGPVLRRWARMWGVEPLTATAAVIEYEFVGTAGSGPIPLGTTIQRVDGIEYVTDGASVEAPAGIFRSTATCRTIGEIGNAALGTFLDLVNPIAGEDPAPATRWRRRGLRTVGTRDRRRGRRLRVPARTLRGYRHDPVHGPRGHGDRRLVAY